MFVNGRLQAWPGQERRHLARHGTRLRIANRGIFLINQGRFYRELGHEFGLQ
jgi:hypothetical protein